MARFQKRPIRPREKTARKNTGGCNKYDARGSITITFFLTLKFESLYSNFIGVFFQIIISSNLQMGLFELNKFLLFPNFCKCLNNKVQLILCMSAHNLNPDSRFALR